MGDGNWALIHLQANYTQTLLFKRSLYQTQNNQYAINQLNHESFHQITQ